MERFGAVQMNCLTSDSDAQHQTVITLVTKYVVASDFRCVQFIPQNGMKASC